MRDAVRSILKSTLRLPVEIVFWPRNIKTLRMSPSLSHLLFKWFVCLHIFTYTAGLLSLAAHSKALPAFLAAIIHIFFVYLAIGVICVYPFVYTATYIVLLLELKSPYKLALFGIAGVVSVYLSFGLALFYSFGALMHLGELLHYVGL